MRTPHPQHLVRGAVITPRRRQFHWRLTGMIILSAIAVTAATLGILEARAHHSAQQAHITHEKELAAMQHTIDTLTKKAADARAKEQAAKKAAAQKAKEEVAHTANTQSPAPVTPAAATCDVTKPDSLTIVINKKHCFVPLSWAPTDLTTIDGIMLRSVAAKQLEVMKRAAAKAGLPFSLTSGYRSYANWVAVNGSAAAADTVSARPGFSEHQTGLAADLKTDGCVLECFATTAQYTWLTQHAADYGFIERYPQGLTSITGYSPEAWHWRYVGSTVALDMKAKGITTLEAYYNISGGDYR